MKISIDVEATPEELRRFIGLPELQPLQEEMLEAIRARMNEGRDGYDPLTLMRPFLPAAYQNMDAMQKLFWEALRQGGKASSGTGEQQEPGGGGKS